MPRRQSRSVYDRLPCSPQREHFLRRASGVRWINPAFDGKNTARPTTRLLPPVNDFPVAVNDRAGVERLLTGPESYQSSASLFGTRHSWRSRCVLSELSSTECVGVYCSRFVGNGNDRSLLDRVVFLVLQCLPLLCAQSLPFCFR